MKLRSWQKSHAQQHFQRCAWRARWRTSCRPSAELHILLLVESSLSLSVAQLQLATILPFLAGALQGLGEQQRSVAIVRSLRRAGNLAARSTLVQCKQRYACVSRLPFLYAQVWHFSCTSLFCWFCMLWCRRLCMHRQHSAGAWHGMTSASLTQTMGLLNPVTLSLQVGGCNRGARMFHLLQAHWHCGFRRHTGRPSAALLLLQAHITTAVLHTSAAACCGASDAAGWLANARGPGRHTAYQQLWQCVVMVLPNAGPDNARRGAS
jgi:hypothetical protein